MPITQGHLRAEFILSEGNGSISREEIVIAAAAAAMPAGTVVGIITASGKYGAYSNANSDGTQTAIGILYDNIPDKAVDQKAVIITRMAEVMGAELTGYDAAAGVELAARNLIVRF